MHSRMKLPALLAALVMMVMLAACAPIAGETTGATTAETPAETPAETSGEGGTVVVYTAGPGGLANAIAEGFQTATGITVEMFQGTTGSVLGRLEAEQGNPNADVVVLASWPSALGLYESGLLMQYAEAENADLLVEAWNMDGYLFGYSASALGITYNTTMVDGQPGTDWDSFTDPAFQDIVAMPDPSESGSALDFVAGYISNNPDTGWQLFEALADNGLQIVGANNPALDSVISGSNALVLAGVDYMAYSGIAQGEPLGIFYPASGTVVNPRPAMILNSAPNADNARAFIDYLLSDEAQQMVANAYLLPGRQDISAHPDRVGLNDIPQFEIDWNWMAANQEEINARFQEIMR